MKLSDFHVGDEVLVGRFFGKSTRDGDILYSREKVVKVGRKYVTTSNDFGLQRSFELYYEPFNKVVPYALLEHTESPVAHLLWPTEKALEDYQRHIVLRAWAGSELGCRNVDYTDEQLAAVRAILQNGSKPLYPELGELGYRDDGDGPTVTLADPFEKSVQIEENFGTYLITFAIPDGERYYCYVSGRSKYEALGVFFESHPHINGDMIVSSESI